MKLLVTMFINAFLSPLCPWLVSSFPFPPWSVVWPLFRIPAFDFADEAGVYHEMELAWNWPETVPASAGWSSIPDS